MEIKQTGNTKIIFAPQSSIASLAEDINNEYEDLKNHHLIIDYRENINAGLNDVLPLLKLSDKHRGNKKSFIIVIRDFDFDEAPDELNVVPTIQEAHDIIEMEEIERDLGF